MKINEHKCKWLIPTPIEDLGIEGDFWRCTNPIHTYCVFPGCDSSELGECCGYFPQEKFKV